MPQEQDLPVFLFTGFLESGKTKFIQETLEDKKFNSGERFLYLICEEGEEELELSALPYQNIVSHVIEDESELTEENLSRLAKESMADRVLIEYNGMWQLQTLFMAMPQNWAVYQEFLFADATTFMNYNANMRSLVVDKLNSCDLVAFNRFDEGFDPMEFHQIVRAISRRTDIVYEYANGRIQYDEIEDPLPFDIDAPVITIEDRDFAFFYRDIMEDAKKYDGKTVAFKGIIGIDPKFPKETFAIGRQIMTCCEADITYSCFVAQWAGTNTLRPGQWLRIKAKISVTRHKLYRGKGPVLQIEEAVQTGAPEQPVATFF